MTAVDGTEADSGTQGFHDPSHQKASDDWLIQYGRECLLADLSLEYRRPRRENNGTSEAVAAALTDVANSMPAERLAGYGLARLLDDLHSEAGLK